MAAAAAAAAAATMVTTLSTAATTARRQLCASSFCFRESERLVIRKGLNFGGGGVSALFTAAARSTLKLNNQRQTFATSPSLQEPPRTPLLLLWKNEIDNGKDPGNDNNNTKIWRPPILYHFSKSQAMESGLTHTVSSVDQAVQVIHSHYSDKSHFVGGMGERDLGVAMAACDVGDDVLDYGESLVQIIQTVKEERHGVPFYLLTTGIAKEENVDWVNIWNRAKIKAWIVSLYAASPMEYQMATGGGGSAAHFGAACGFLTDVAEQGQAPAEAVVLPSHAVGGREMALFMGARKVHVAHGNDP